MHPQDTYRVDNNLVTIVHHSTIPLNKFSHKGLMSVWKQYIMEARSHLHAGKAYLNILHYIITYPLRIKRHMKTFVQYNKVIL